LPLRGVEQRKATITGERKKNEFISSLQVKQLAILMT
jgi:hypothetical protein